MRGLTGLPDVAVEAAALVLRFKAVLDADGLAALQARLRAERANPRFDTWLCAPMELAYTYFPPKSAGDGGRTADARRQSPNLETWIAVPLGFRDKELDLTKTSEQSVGLSGFLVVYRRQPRAWCITALMNSKKKLTFDQRRARARELFERWKFWQSSARPVDPSLRALCAGQGPAGLPAGFTNKPTPISYHYVWLQAEDRHIDVQDLGAVVGLRLGADGILTEAERAKCSSYIQTLVMQRIRTSGDELVDTPKVARAVAQAVGGFDDAAPGALNKYISTSFNRELWRLRKGDAVGKADQEGPDP